MNRPPPGCNLLTGSNSQGKGSRIARAGAPDFGNTAALFSANHGIDVTSGNLSDSRGRLLTDYTVVVFATERERWFPASRFLRQTRPGKDGVFRVRGLSDGEYFVAAVDRLQADEWQDPDFLESILSRATQVTLREGQRLSVSPKLLAR